MESAVYILKYPRNKHFKIETSRKRVYEDYKTFCEVSGWKPLSANKVHKTIKEVGSITHREGKLKMEISLLRIGVSYNY